MATLDWDCTRVDGVTLVELVVTSERTERIRIESKLTPVWPPRRQGLPATGWDGSTFEGTVEAGKGVVVGYASPAEPAGRPAELTTAPPQGSKAVSPRALVQALGDGTPPRDAVPTGGGVSSTAGTPGADRRGELPAAAESYFEAVESRLASAERLTDPDDVERARAAVRDVDGIDTVPELRRQLRADRSTLDRLAKRQQALTCRLDAVELPVESSERTV